MIRETPLEEAKWALCNMTWDEDAVPSMEKASEAAMRAVAAYLGLDEDEWEHVVPAKRFWFSS